LEGEHDLDLEVLTAVLLGCDIRPEWETSGTLLFNSVLCLENMWFKLLLIFVFAKGAKHSGLLIVSFEEFLSVPNVR
jgi:hypothetical protein